MHQYICHIDHNLWDVIVNGDLEEEPAPTTGETSAPPAPKTAKQLAARRNQERVKSILLLAIPDEYRLKFYNVVDAKSLWEAIKSRFGALLLLHNQQPVLNLRKRIFTDGLEMTGGTGSFDGSIATTVTEKCILLENVDLKGVKEEDLMLTMKAIKERDELKDKIVKWEESTKNLEEILKSQMSARDKTGLDEYAIRNKIIESQTTELNNKTSETAGKTNDANTKKPKPSISTARPSVSTARPVYTVRPSINTARPVNTASLSISTARPVYAFRPIYPRMDNIGPRGSCSPIKRSCYTKPAFRPKDLKQDVKIFGVKNTTTAGTRAVVNTGKGKLNTDLKWTRWVWRPKGNYLAHVSKDNGSYMLKKGNPGILLQDHAVVDSGFSSHMTGNKAYLSDYEYFNGGFVAFGSDPKGGKITGKGKIKTANLDFEDVYFVDELNFKLLYGSQVVLRAPRKDDVYNLDLKNLVPTGDKDVQDTEDAADKEEQHQMTESAQDLQDELEKMITQELAAKAMNDDSRQAFEEEKRRITSQKKEAQATSTNILSTDRPFVSTDKPFVSTDKPSVSIISTPTTTNVSESSFVYLGGTIPIDASTLPNADLPIDPNMPDLEDASETLPNDGIFNGAYDDNECI
ncbi:hypothetical protein Tco_1294801 [Tanacetum coccineum]